MAWWDLVALAVIVGSARVNRRGDVRADSGWHGGSATTIASDVDYPLQNLVDGLVARLGGHALNDGRVEGAECQGIGLLWQEQDPVGELVDGAGPAADGETSVSEVDVVQEQFTDRFGAGGVDRGQDQHEPGDGCRRGLGRLVQLGQVQGQGNAVVRSPTLMPRSGLRKMLCRLLQKANSDRAATRVLDRRDPWRSSKTASTSSRVTSRRWS